MLVVLLTGNFPDREIWGLVVFLAAAMTDYLDGYLARKRSQVTTLGKLLDPIADKILISAALVALVELGGAPAWMVIIIVGREFAVIEFDVKESPLAPDGHYIGDLTRSVAVQE